MKKIPGIYRRWTDSLQKYGYEPEELVFGVGNPNAEVLLIGEAPGAEEVAAGEPFVGKAGKNLNEFLSATGIARETLYITNVVKFRPYRVSASGRKSNRPPSKKEIALCAGCLEEEISAIVPKVIVTLGNTALQAVLGEEMRIGICHGMVQAVEPPVFPLYHPASIIYRPSLREEYARDMEKLRFYLKRKLLEVSYRVPFSHSHSEQEQGERKRND